MKIGGFQKFSLIDYPGKTCAVIFTQGCNFKCPFCHNPELVLPELFDRSFNEEDIIEFLVRRMYQLDGVVVSGGEPTIQPDIIPFLQKIKAMEYSIKLDTNGSHPDIIEELIIKSLVDFIAMDIKAPVKKYHCVAGVDINSDNIERSIQIIEESGLDHEFRTTLTKPLLKCYDLMHILAMVRDKNRLKIKNCNTRDKIMDKSLADHEQYTDSQIDTLREQLNIYQ